MEFNKTRQDYLRHKVREAMKSSENKPMDGNAEVDEFVIGGKKLSTKHKASFNH